MGALTFFGFTWYNGSMNIERGNTDRPATPEEVREAIQEAVHAASNEVYQNFKSTRDQIAGFIEKGNHSHRLQEAKKILDEILLLEKQLKIEQDPTVRATLEDEHQRLLMKSFDTIPTWPPQFDEFGNFIGTDMNKRSDNLYLADNEEPYDPDKDSRDFFNSLPH